MNRPSRSLGVCVLGWTVILANIVLYLVYYFNLLPSASALIRHLISLVSMLAVFPYDLFAGYFSGTWLPQMVWVMTMVICAFGILLLNKLARAVFIILNILQIVILLHLVSRSGGTGFFLDMVFKLYLTVVVSGSYIAYLLVPQVRRQFDIDLEGLRLQIFLQRPLGKTVTASDAKKYADLAAAYSRLERYDEAAGALRKALTGAPENAAYHFQLGLVLLKQDDSRQAAAAFEQAVRYDPLHYEAYYNLGVLSVRQGCSQEAYERFLQASQVRPGEPQVCRDLGDAACALERYQDAADFFRRAISLGNGDAYAYFRLGCLEADHLQRPQKALEALRTAVTIDGNFCEAHFQLGMVCITMQRYKEALRAFKEVIRLQGDHRQGRYQLGFVYAMLGDQASARHQCNILKEADPELAQNLSMLLAR